MSEDIPESVTPEQALALTIHFYKKLQKENAELKEALVFAKNTNSFVCECMTACDCFIEEYKSIKARLAHVESEYAKEREVTNKNLKASSLLRVHTQCLGRIKERKEFE